MITTPEIIRKVNSKIGRNLCNSVRKMAHELNISRERKQHILKNELGLKSLVPKSARANQCTKKSETVRNQGVASLARKWLDTEFCFLRLEVIPNRKICDQTN